jgi:hypothetical protein
VAGKGGEEIPEEPGERLAVFSERTREIGSGRVDLRGF